MASLPRPLIALLVATVAAFGLWYVELRPSSSSAGGSPQGVGAYQSAINQAHQAVKISGAANAKLGAPTSTGRAPTSPTPAKPTAPAKSAAVTAPRSAEKAAAKPGVSTRAVSKPATSKHAASRHAAKPVVKSLSTAQQVSEISNAIAAHKVVAVLFYNPAAADDHVMAQELAAVSSHGGQVVKLAVPVSELTSFAIITQQIPVVTAPTLVVIDAARQATEITGFADTLEISASVDDALAAK